MTNKKLILPILGLLVGSLLLTGCTDDIVNPVRTTPNPTATTPPVSEQPDVLVPISAALEAAIRNDVDVTKRNVELFLMTNPAGTPVPAEQILNRNPTLATIEVTYEEGSFTVTGKQIGGSYVYTQQGYLQ